MSRLQPRSGSFERASQRKAENLAQETISKHLASAQVNHKERTGKDLERTEELRGIIKESKSGASVADALAAPLAPDLELLALLEGHLDHLRVEHAGDAAIWAHAGERVKPAGLQVASAVAHGSVLDALHAALGTPHDSRELAHKLADKIELLAHENVSLASVPFRDLVTWGRLPDECASPHDWVALASYIRQYENLDQVGADWAILAAAALELGRQILVFNPILNVAVRFVGEDTSGAGGFVPAAHLAPGSDWIRLAIVDGCAFVALERVPVAAERLLGKLEQMNAMMEEQISAYANPPAHPLTYPLPDPRQASLHPRRFRACMRWYT